MAPPQEQDYHDKKLGGDCMFAKARDWAKGRSSIYLLTASLGALVVVDALTPGCQIVHVFMCGLGIVSVAGYVWLGLF